MSKRWVIATLELTLSIVYGCNSTRAESAPGIPLEIGPGGNPSGRSRDDDTAATQWMDEVAAESLPGSKREGFVTKHSVSRANEATIELPPKMSDTCWIVLVTQGSAGALLNFELNDTDQRGRFFGAVTKQRSALPVDGPFCPISARFRALTVSTQNDVSVSFRVAFYAATPSTGYAQ